ncbi:MAG: SusC/RagA family TonB-linked outer membrane protein [Bacteroidia bacterium]|nr:SusC/RagA family TonB-linked outer membrane protein [Bacteroidia bacterium]
MRQTTNTTLLLMMMVLMPVWMMAQRNIGGKITDSETNEPIVGASVLVVGTSIGALTNNDGAFSLSVPDGSNQLKVSYFGFDDVTVDLGESNNLSISMTRGKTLDEVLVIGYGTIEKDDATGSVAAVDEEVFNRGAITSPQDLLAGKVAGVSITPGAAPGDGAAIRIRGGSSLSASNDPLIVIDGVPVSNDGISGSRNALNVINPNDIETFTVLKDASATAIYGSRASNGVILITTKKGAKGKLKVGYNGSVAFSNRANNVDIYDAEGFTNLVNEVYAEGHPARDLIGTANTDWQGEIFQQGITHDHNINLSGAVGEVPYRLGLGFTDRTGILKTDRFTRETFSLNLSPKLMDGKLQLNAGAKGMLSQNQFADQGAINAANSFDPTKPVNQDNEWGGYYIWTDNDGNPNLLAPPNPLALLNQRTNVSDVYRVILNASADYRILPELRANLNLGLDFSHGQGTDDIATDAAFASANGGQMAVYENDNSNRLLEFYLNYTKDFGNQKIDVMGGYSYQNFYRFNSFYSVSAVDPTDSLVELNRDPRRLNLQSLFTRVNYNLGDNFLATFTLRADASSRFAEGNRWGYFPAAAIAYKVVSGKAGVLNDLKVRLGWGITGQQDIGDNFYPALPTYTLSTGTAAVQFGNQFIPTFRPNGYAADIKWEETTTYNLAVDYTMANGRVFGSVEVYQRDTRDLLNFIPVAAGTNLTNFITTNIGELQNRGFEFSINATPVKTDKVSWDFGFNVNFNQNEIIKLIATDDSSYQGVFTGGIAGGVGNTIQIHSVGFPASSFFVYEQVYDENNIPIEGLVVDRNGDGQITPNDRYRLNQPAPTAVFGFTSSLYLGDFSFLFAGRANVGNYIYNNVWSSFTNLNGIYNSTDFLNNRSTESTAIDFMDSQFFSDHFIRDGSFLRLDHITVGYDFSSMVDKIQMLNLNVVVQNPFVLTQYEGIDPEIFGGIDNNIYPRSRTIMIGVNAAF